MRPFQMLMVMILLNLFYSVGITLLAHSLSPIVDASQQTMLTKYAGQAKDLNTYQEKISTNLGSQFNVPLVDLGALVFYSGNLVADLMLNFFLAAPSLVSLIINTIFVFIPLDPTITNYLKQFFFIVTAIIYFMFIIAFILQVRSRGSLV